MTLLDTSSSSGPNRSTVFTVAILGIGMIGLSIAWSLHQRATNERWMSDQQLAAKLRDPAMQIAVPTIKTSGSLVKLSYRSTPEQATLSAEIAKRAKDNPHLLLELLADADPNVVRAAAYISQSQMVPGLSLKGPLLTTRKEWMTVYREHLAVHPETTVRVIAAQALGWWGEMNHEDFLRFLDDSELVVRRYVLNGIRSYDYYKSDASLSAGEKLQLFFPALLRHVDDHDEKVRDKVHLYFVQHLYMYLKRHADAGPEIRKLLDDYKAAADAVDPVKLGEIKTRIERIWNTYQPQLVEQANDIWG